MRAICLSVFLLVATLGGAVPALSQTAQGPQADRAAVQAVIRSQLGSFAADNGPAAYSYAAPGIRARFPTADAFMTMVRTRYAAVYRARNVHFGRFVARGSSVLQEVLMSGPGGGYWEALYLLQRQLDGGWKIAGVTLRRARSI